MASKEKTKAAYSTMTQDQNSLFRYESNPDDGLGRRLIASTHIQEGRLVFVERPFIAMQTMGNMHEGALVCNYCFAFCGSPKQALDVIADPSCLQEITTTNSQCIPVDEGKDLNVLRNPHALHACRHKCGVVYCSLECQQDDWEWGGHEELCTGTIPEPDEPDSEEQQNDETDETDSNMHPLLKFKMHAMETNEIFLLVAVWLVRILKSDLPYNDDDNRNTHPYTNFQMNAWWDVKANEEEMLKLVHGNKKDKDDAGDENEGESLGKVLKKLCEESHSHLSQNLKSRLPSAESSPWLSAIGIARLIGSLEQNCLGIRRKHALQREIMEDSELRKEYHGELIQCLEGAGVFGDDDESEHDHDHSHDHDHCHTHDHDHDHDHDNCHDHDHNHSNATQGDIEATTTTEVDNDDQDESEDGDLEYSPDDVASILADLKPDLTNNCMVDEWDSVIRPLDGVSHYSIATKMNHSCDPNVILVYKTRGWGRDHPLAAYIVALRDISPGEELTISYITSDDSYEERQAALANYGFICKCLKCQKEKTGVVEGGNSAQPVDEDDLFGDDDDDAEDEDEKEEEDLFGGDEDGPFGDDEDEGEQNGNEAENEDDNEEEPSGEEQLSNLAERIDSILNKSKHLAIPLTCLAPASNYVIQQVSSLLEDISNETSFDESRDTISNLLQQNRTAIRDRDFASCRIVGSDLESYLYNQLQSNGSWDTPMHRASYWCASITASIGYAHEGSFLVAMKYLDKATILGQDRSILTSYFDYVELYASQMAKGPCPIAVQCKVSDFQCPKLREEIISKALPKAIEFPIQEIFSADESNRTNILDACNQSKPIVIRGLASTWPAVTKWRNMDALAQIHGHRLVPIEVGSMSTGGMKEAVVPFRQFVGNYLSPSAEKDCWSLDDATAENNQHIAYLAQHPLLNQIPALWQDIERNPCEVNPTNVNIWMGTGGTRTPLHYDTYDNLLIQLVGAKYVRLYSKSSSPKLYVSKNQSYGGQGNMSDLDCEREDFQEHPLAKDCCYTELVLFPGDCLFIPSREWHYVRSLSSSVSVNFWF